VVVIFLVGDVGDCREVEAGFDGVGDDGFDGVGDDGLDGVGDLDFSSSIVGKSLITGFGIFFFCWSSRFTFTMTRGVLRRRDGKLFR